MQIFKLNATHNPGDTIGNFESLAWTERYQAAGDFQLVVENEISILDTLPKGVLISHTDTTEVMIVENHEIDRDASKSLKVTISGRSFETFSENRTTLASEYPLVDPITEVAFVEQLTLTVASEVAMYLLKSRLEPGEASAADAVPNLLVYTDMRVLDDAMDHVIKRGDIYARVLEALRICGAGVKTMRPYGAQTTMDLVIHDGVDLTDIVVFYAQNEDLENAKYFWSIKGYKNMALVAAHKYVRYYLHRDLGVAPTGLNRRILYVEAADLEDIYDPPSASDVISARGQSALDEKQSIALISAQISNTAKPKFKYDYNIGDLVTVFGEFASSQTMRVTEHILTVDKGGMRGYPSLSIP